MAIKVLLVDDHTLVRNGIRKVIEEDPSIRVVGEADNGRKAVEMAAGESPDVVVMDLVMPEMNGIDAARQISEKGLGCKVIVLTMHSTKTFIAQSLAVGVKGYVLKDCAAEELIEAITTVAANSVYLSPKISATIAEDYQHRSRMHGPLAGGSLSAREREVLQLFAEGHNTKEIAFRLNLSVKTVDTHKMNIMTKTKSQNVAEMIKYAIREGICHL